MKFGVGFELFVQRNCSYIYLVKNFYVRILGSIILNIFAHSYDDILCHKCILCICVLPEDGHLRPKHVGEIIMTKQIFMREYLQLVGINIV